MTTTWIGSSTVFVLVPATGIFVSEVTSRTEKNQEEPLRHDDRRVLKCGYVYVEGEGKRSV